MAGFERSEWINKTPLEIFDFITDPAQAPKVIKGVIGMEKITDGPVGAGTQFRETRLMNGKEETAVLQVVACEPGRNYSVTNVTEAIEVTYHYTFVSEKEGTRVNLTCHVSASGLKKAMVPVVTAVMKKMDGDHLERLKAVMEGGEIAKRGLG